MFNIDQDIYLKLRGMAESEKTPAIKELMEHLRPCLFSDYEQLQYLLQSKYIIMNYIEKLICFSFDVNQECLKKQYNLKGDDCCNLCSAYSIIFELQTKTSDFNTKKNPVESQVFRSFLWELNRIQFIQKELINKNTFTNLKNFITILFDALKIKSLNYDLN